MTRSHHFPVTCKASAGRIISLFHCDVQAEKKLSEWHWRHLLCVLQRVVKPATIQSKITEADQLPVRSFWLIYIHIYLYIFNLEESSSCGNTSLDLRGRRCQWDPASVAVTGGNAALKISPLLFTSRQPSQKPSETPVGSRPFPPFMLTWSESARCVSSAEKFEQERTATCNIFRLGSASHSTAEGDKW